MNTNSNDASNNRSRNSEVKRSSSMQDLPDSPHDLERMQPEEVTLDLPDVEDIPGQEHFHVAPLGELADVTISSDDEEGVGLFVDDEDDETTIVMGSEADVTAEERSTLQTMDEDLPSGDDSRLRKAGLDNEDIEGDALNEGSLANDVSGADLDVSGVDADDPAEAIGEEDEENNTYSLGSDSNDNITEGTP